MTWRRGWCKEQNTSKAGEMAMERLGKSTVVAIAVLFPLLLAAVNASPVQRDRAVLPATRRLVELTARRLGELREPLQTTRDGQGVGGGSGLTCDACKIIVDTLDTMFMENRTWDDIVAVATEICIELKIEDRNVCTLVVKEFEVEVLTVFEKVALGKKEICGYIIGGSCADDYNPWEQNWNVTIPGGKPPVVPVNPPKPGSPTNRILFLTDMHWDPYYTPGLSNDCGEPLCCRPPNPKGSGSTAAGNWGDYQCDVPYRTLESLMQFIVGMSDEFDWVYWTGDLPAHYVWNQTRENQLYIMDTLCDMMKKYLPGKIVFPSLGNHEGVPVNAFPPPYVTGEDGESWLLQDASKQWYSWLSQLPDWETTLETITYGGFYNVKVREGLRVISLQTNFANSGNYWLLINSTDPAGQLKWLVDQLLQAEKDGDKVHIIGHIFPSSYMKEFGWNYHKIITRFESTITGQFFGHTHQDSWQVFFDDSNRTRATNIAYMGPAVTTYQGLNLGFRIYTMDGDYNGTSNALLDHESYWLNLTEANLKDKAEWKFEYSAKEAYGLESLQPQEWAKLINRFKTDDALFQKFWDYKFKMHAGPCDASCRASSICGLQRTRTDSPYPCTDLPPGVTMDDVLTHLKKDIMC